MAAGHDIKTYDAKTQNILQDLRARPQSDEVIYFVLPDRFENGDTCNDNGGIKGDRLKTGFDPSHKGFYHGGDLKGLINRLDYIQGMGVTAIWFAPIFKNKPVQGPKNGESAGYHGYWVTDFTSVDPHFGSNEEFKAFVDAAHARGMKVYMDIITNHSADVLKTKECAEQNQCEYRSKADYPYTTLGGVDGPAINEGFMGDHIQTKENFEKLTNPNYAGTVMLAKEEANIKKPDWMNNPIYYHNRGDTTFQNESSQYGDFVGLDDFMTENPVVVDGFIDVYADWIEKYGIDGYRIDTARHVNHQFWQKFIPAILEKAKNKGIPNFHIFGEVYGDGVNPGYLAQFSRRDGFPALLDFSFQAAVRQAVGQDDGGTGLRTLFSQDILYEGGDIAAKALPTFLGNHDMGRLSGMIKQDRPGISNEELLKRVQLAHALLMTLRGVPTIYSGDEQGFVSDGNDQDAREDMFPSKTAVYNDNVLIGTNATTADSNFDMGHPIYQLISSLADIRSQHKALRSGDQKLRLYGEKSGIIAVSRFDPDDGSEYLLLFNSANENITANVEVDGASMNFENITGSCPKKISTTGSIKVQMAPLSFAICRAIIGAE
ncbi:alpha-amylase [Sphingorhabdus lutea]|uniref:Alpha-amylase n=2 Tax=Sphingorhabdus lutea TaxID=1913578 RepID=A0A1L3JEQ7_9SPHN|nr:alpha-amylase [Sphingorhabdus lutea]